MILAQDCHSLSLTVDGHLIRYCHYAVCLFIFIVFLIRIEYVLLTVCLTSANLAFQDTFCGIFEVEQP